VTNGFTNPFLTENWITEKDAFSWYCAHCFPLYCFHCCTARVRRTRFASRTPRSESLPRCERRSTPWRVLTEFVRESLPNPTPFQRRPRNGKLSKKPVASVPTPNNILVSHLEVSDSCYVFPLDKCLLIGFPSHKCFVVTHFSSSACYSDGFLFFLMVDGFLLHIFYFCLLWFRFIVFRWLMVCCYTFSTSAWYSFCWLSFLMVDGFLLHIFYFCLLWFRFIVFRWLMVCCYTFSTSAWYSFCWLSFLMVDGLLLHIFYFCLI
jgi:hypothetical protein